MAYRIIDEAETLASSRREGADQYAREILFGLEERLADLLGQVRRGIDAINMEVTVRKPESSKAQSPQSPTPSRQPSPAAGGRAYPSPLHPNPSSRPQRAWKMGSAKSTRKRDIRARGEAGRRALPISIVVAGADDEANRQRLPPRFSSLSAGVSSSESPQSLLRFRGHLVCDRLLTRILDLHLLVPRGQARCCS